MVAGAANARIFAVRPSLTHFHLCSSLLPQVVLSLQCGPGSVGHYDSYLDLAICRHAPPQSAPVHALLLQ